MEHIWQANSCFSAPGSCLEPSHPPYSIQIRLKRTCLDFLPRVGLPIWSLRQEMRKVRGTSESYFLITSLKDQYPKRQNFGIKHCLILLDLHSYFKYCFLSSTFSFCQLFFPLDLLPCNLFFPSRDWLLNWFVLLV